MAKCLYDATLDGVSIHSLADEIILLDIVENPVDMDIQSAKRSMHPGTRVTSRIRRKLEIDLACVIYTQDSTRRAEVASLLAAWANAGGWLTVSTRPGKQLYVRSSKMPAQGSALRWQDDITFTLTAYEQPYWEDEDAQFTSFDTEWDESTQVYRGSAVLQPDGNAGKVPITVLMETIGETTLTHVKIISGDTGMELVGLDVVGTSNSTSMLNIVYSDDDVLSIAEYGPNGAVSAMKNRTAESSDDLLAICREINNVIVFSDAPVHVMMMTRGRWL